MRSELTRIGEVGLIDRLARLCPTASPRLRLGIGDDAAVLRTRPGFELLTTTDVMVERIDFYSTLWPFDRLGEKALAVNLSDIAAMGGAPLAFFVMLSIPPRARLRDIEAMYRGFGRCARRYGVVLGGGDISAARIWSIGVTVLGEVPRGLALRRDGARIGDVVCVTGTLGDSGAGLALLGRRGKLPTGVSRLDARYLIDRHQRPTPRLAVGQRLAERVGATAAIDLSDGLARDVRHLCRASRVGVEIDLSAVPLSRPLRTCARALGLDPVRLALGAGEDFELLATIPPDRWAKTRDLLARGNARMTAVGRITSAKRGLHVLDSSGRRKALPSLGYDHLRGGS